MLSRNDDGRVLRRQRVQIRVVSGAATPLGLLLAEGTKQGGRHRALGSMACAIDSPSWIAKHRSEEGMCDGLACEVGSGECATHG